MSGRVLWKREVECETKTEHAIVDVVEWEGDGDRTIDVEYADYLGIDDAEALAAAITEAVKVAREVPA